MAEAAAFTEMINAGREKKKREQLAQKILGTRRSSGAGSLPTRKSLSNTGGVPSLASRVGVTKPPPRSQSTTPKPNIDRPWTHDLHHVNNTQNSRAGSGAARSNRMQTGLQRALSSDATSQVNIRKSNGPSMSIKGMATPSGPYVVIASNFAPGTTAADIEAAMQPVGGEITSCRLVSSNPTVMAELIFGVKEGAENVIATFNNQKADGRLLYVYMKQGGPTPGLHPLQTAGRSTISTAPIPTKTESPAPIPVHERTPLGEETSTQPSEKRDLMDVDNEDQARDERDMREPRYGDRDRYRDNGHRNSYQNGNSGFRNSYDRREPSRNYGRDRGPRGLYSDTMYGGDNRYRR